MNKIYIPDGKRISVRVNEGQYRTLKNYTDYYNMTDSTFIRKCLRINDIGENQEFMIVNGKMIDVTPKEVSQRMCTLKEYYYTQDHREKAEKYRNFIAENCDTDDVKIFFGNGITRIYLGNKEYIAFIEWTLEEYGYTLDYYLFSKSKTEKLNYDLQENLENADITFSYFCRKKEWDSYLSMFILGATEQPHIEDFIDSNGGTTTPPLESIINNQ